MQYSSFSNLEATRKNIDPLGRIKIRFNSICIKSIVPGKVYCFFDIHYENNTAARIMSTTSKISNTGGWLNPQLEKKLNLLFSYRNIWKHKIEFINIKNYYSSTNVCTIYSIFWTWIWKISIASWNKKLAFYCKYLAFFTIFWHWNLNSKNWHFTTNWETSNPPAYQFWTYYPR